jgi:integrase
MTNITTRTLDALKPTQREQFIRDNKLAGFGVRVSPKGKITFIAEGRIKGAGTRRKTLGTYPAMEVEEARFLARLLIRQMQQGVDPVKAAKAKAHKEQSLSKSVEGIFLDYLRVRTLKPKTEKDYRNTFYLVFDDWKDRPARDITRSDAQELFFETRDNRGLAMAGLAFRIISAVFNMAKADEVAGERLIKENPVDVLKDKRIDRKVDRRKRYLSDAEIAKFVELFHDALNFYEREPHGVTRQGGNYVMLLLATGLRKSEALALKWIDVDWTARHFVVHNTKNGTDHYVPLSSLISHVLLLQRQYLDKEKNESRRDSVWVFPNRYGTGHMTEPKSQLARIKEATGLEFSFHDLRRTFAQHAHLHGIEHPLIQRALNHKTGSITDQYISTQIETLRPVFEAVADGYHTYYDPDWKTREAADAAYNAAIERGDIKPEAVKRDVEFLDYSSPEGGL